MSVFQIFMFFKQNNKCYLIKIKTESHRLYKLGQILKTKVRELLFLKFIDKAGIATTNGF